MKSRRSYVKLVKREMPERPCSSYGINLNSTFHNISNKNFQTSSSFHMSNRPWSSVKQRNNLKNSNHKLMRNNQDPYKIIIDKDLDMKI